MIQEAGEYKGYRMYFEGISYNCPTLKLRGFSTDLALMRAIDRVLRRRLKLSKIGLSETDSSERKL